MATEDFCLKWNDHHSIFFSLAENLCQSEHLTDVTLSTGSKLFPAHKLVLSVCSSYFQNLFRNSLSGDKNAVVYLKDVDPRHIELLLGYMYRGEINVQETELMSLLNTAKGLQIKGLSDDGGDMENEPDNASPSSEAKKQKTQRFQPPNNLKKKADSLVDSSEIIPVKKIKEESDVTPVNISQPSWREEIGAKAAATGGGGGTAATAGFDSRSDIDVADNDYNEDIYIEGDGEYASVPEDRRLDMYNPEGPLDPGISDSWGLGNPSNQADKKDDKLNSPHICEMCNQAFSQRWLLKRHWRTHTGIQPFACLVCHRRFSLRDSCLRHIKTVHKELDIPAANVNQLMVNMDVEESEEPAISPSLQRHEPLKLSIE